MTDTYNHRIRRVESGGTLSTAMASPDGKSMRYPTDLAFGDIGNIYVVDSDCNQLLVRSGKSGLTSPKKEVHVKDNKASSLAAPTQVDFFEGKLYVADTMRDRILVLDPETFSGESLPVKRPLGVVVNRKTREITFTLRNANRIFVWRDNDIHVLAGTMFFGFNDGREAATFHDPYGLACDSSGNIIVADSGNHSIRFIDPEGSVTTLAGNRVKGAEDGRNATFNYPMGVATMGDGSIIVADTYNNKVRRIWPNLEVETVV